MEERAARVDADAEPNHAPEEELERQSARNAAQRDGAGRAEIAAREGRARRLAIGLSLHPDDPARAARSVGLDVDGAELGQLAGEALAHHADLVRLEPAAIGRVMLAAIALGAVRQFETVQTIAPSQIPAAMKQATQALELLQGDTDPVVSELSVVFKTPEGTAWDPNTLLPPALRSSATSPATASSGTASPSTSST